MLTDNGAEFTDRFKTGATLGQGAKPTGRNPFDPLCKAAGISHRLTRPYRPQTNGMGERFNRRLSEAIRTRPQSRRNSRFASNREREEFLLIFANNYNRTRLRCLNYKAPAEVLTSHTRDNTREGQARRCCRAGGFDRAVTLAERTVIDGTKFKNTTLVQPYTNSVRLPFAVNHHES